MDSSVISVGWIAMAESTFEGHLGPLVEGSSAATIVVQLLFTMCEISDGSLQREV
jgi:hypothetical protein